MIPVPSKLLPLGLLLLGSGAGEVLLVAKDAPAPPPVQGLDGGFIRDWLLLGLLSPKTWIEISWPEARARPRCTPTRETRCRPLTAARCAGPE